MQEPRCDSFRIPCASIHFLKTPDCDSRLDGCCVMRLPAPSLLAGSSRYLSSFYATSTSHIPVTLKHLYTALFLSNTFSNLTTSQHSYQPRKIVVHPLIGGAVPHASLLLSRTSQIPRRAKYRTLHRTILSLMGIEMESELCPSREVRGGRYNAWIRTWENQKFVRRFANTRPLASRVVYLEQAGRVE